MGLLRDENFILYKIGYKGYQTFRTLRWFQNRKLVLVTKCSLKKGEIKKPLLKYKKN